MSILSFSSWINENSQELTKDQIEWLDKCTKGSWKLNQETGLIDVDGSFYCQRQDLIDFKGVRFGTVSGVFSCDLNQLTSLAGSPEKVGGSFFCRNNQLTSLEGAPKEADRGFFCENNQLTSLSGAPEKVGWDFHCHNNQLTSLAGSPKEVGGYFRCEGNPVSEVALLRIYKLMKRGKSYPEALSQYWSKMPEEDKDLMYKEHPDLSADKRRGYELRGKAAKRIY